MNIHKIHFFVTVALLLMVIGLGVFVLRFSAILRYENYMREIQVIMIEHYIEQEAGFFDPVSGFESSVLESHEVEGLLDLGIVFNGDGSISNKFGDKFVLIQAIGGGSIIACFAHDKFVRLRQGEEIWSPR